MKLTLKAHVELDRQDVSDFLTLEANGWDYWGYVDFKENDYQKARAEMIEKGITGSFSDSLCYEDIVAYMIMDTDARVYVVDEEDEKRHLLTKKKLQRGFELNAERRPHDMSLENGDTLTGDCIMQYAIFGDIIYS